MQEKKLQKSPLVSLETDLALYSDTLKEVSEEIIKEGISKYPIFIAHQHEMSFGEAVIDKDDLATDWNIRVSTMEDFIKTGIIKPEKEDLFIENYKDPKKFICVFVIVPEGANFVFSPYR